MLYVRLTIKVKVGIPESFKAEWYPQKITGSPIKMANFFFAYCWPYTGRNDVFPCFVNSTETGSCLYPSRFLPAETWWSSFPWTGRVSVMFPRRKRTILFPPHFCYHIFVLSCFRYISGDVFFVFFFFLTHVQDRMINVSETLPLRTIKVNKGKFTLEIGPLDGSQISCITRACCIDAKTVKCASFSIAFDYKW